MLDDSYNLFKYNIFMAWRGGILVCGFSSDGMLVILLSSVEVMSVCTLGSVTGGSLADCS